MTATQSCFQRFTSKVERGIATRLIRDLLAKGYYVRIHDGEEFNTESNLNKESEIKDNLATTGEDRIYFSKFSDKQSYLGWIWLVWGNGEDLISDYSANPRTEEIVEPIYDWIES